MNRLKIYTLLVIAGFLIVSCQKDIVFNGRVTTPLLVVNSFITPDSVISAHISESQFFLSSQQTFNLIDNATITLYVNGIEKEKMTHTTDGQYFAAYKPVMGDSIRYRVVAPGKSDVSCATAIEPQTTILSLDTASTPTGSTTPVIDYQSKDGSVPTYDTIGYVTGRRLKFVLNFTDNANKQNFYRLVVITKTTTTYGEQSDYSFSFDDLVSGNTNKDALGFSTSFSTNSYNVFTDDLFNGEHYPLTFSITNDKYVFSPGYEQPTPQVEVTVNLQSISKSYYYYLKSRAVSGENSFFSEPVQVYNNVVGGIGILGSYTSHAMKINLK